MTAQALPLSYLVELERSKIEPAAKLFQQECGGHADSETCKERDELVKALNGLVSLAQKELDSEYPQPNQEAGETGG